MRAHFGADIITIMPGNPEAKLKRIDNLVSWFSELAVDWGQTLPSIYRYDGSKPGRDRRANAWARVDQQVILLAEALSELQTVLRSRVVTTGAQRGKYGHCVQPVKAAGPVS